MKLSLTVLVPLCVILAAAGCATTSLEILGDAAALYRSAGPIGEGVVLDGAGTDTLMKKWQLRVMSPDSRFALIESNGSKVRVLHAGDRHEHLVYAYTDYFYPTEVRQSQNNRYLYVEISGQAVRDPAPRVSRLLIYDMVQRCVIGQAGIGLAPKPAPVTAPAPR
ncbi:MAG: hypothetical protein FJ224_07935 [Lentisphaerae bacterium]|nr:hypothetical protein [Lentisphaerota bacterium]